MTNRTYSIDGQSWADLSMYEIWPISHFKGTTSDFRLGCYNYPRSVLSRFYQFLTWWKTAIYIGFPNYIHAFICVKSLYHLQDKGLRVVVFLYMDMYMQCVYAFVRGYVDLCRMWFWKLYYTIQKIEFNNRVIKSKSKIGSQNWKLNSKMVFDIV